MLSFAFLRTMRARLTLWNMGVLALTLLALGGVLRVIIERNLTTSVHVELAERVRRHQRYWANPPSDSPPPWEAKGAGTSRPGTSERSEPGSFFRRAPLREGGFSPQWQARVVEVVSDLQGNPILRRGGSSLLNQEDFSRAAKGQEVASTVRVGDEQIRLLSAPLRKPDGEIGGVVQVGYSLADVERAIGNLNRTLLTLTPLALAVAGMGGLFLTGRMMRPIRDITQTAARIGAEDLSKRLAVSGDDEFSELAATFNAMLGRLEKAFEQQRRFTADASHELRTPLTVIKANTSLALSRGDIPEAHRKATESIDKAASLMNRIVQDLLLLARSDAGQLGVQMRPIRLSDVLEAAVECVQPQGGAAICNQVTDPALFVQGDMTHLTRLFVNLLENAVRHTPADGRIDLTADGEGSDVTVTVADTGVGIPPEHLPHVFERFYRVDAARSRAQGGTGLGLAICQSIVRAHGGNIEISSEPGKGTTVRVHLLRTPPTDPVGA